MEGSDEQTRNAADAVVRRSYGKLVALLAARGGDLSAAEEALSEAIVVALTTWPRQGCPQNPEAWLLTAARRKLIDGIRQRRNGDAAAAHLAWLAEQAESLQQDADIPDHRLALLFACTHPAIDAAIRAPLMLQVVLGLDAARIGSAFLVSPATMGQRLSRAKNKIRDAGIPIQVPEEALLPERTAAVLDAIYAAFTEGWSDPGCSPIGGDVVRRDLVDEAVFLGRLLIALLPQDPEARGLLALILHAEARRSARRTPTGDYVPLAAQNPADWNEPMIAEAESLLHEASKCGVVGRFQLEAALQSAHVHRRRTGQANWPAVVVLYDALLALTESPVVAINRALAVAETQGPAAALAVTEGLTGDPRLTEYQPFWVARAELLARTGRNQEAYAAFEMAIGLERDPAVRRFLQGRQQALKEVSGGPVRAAHRLPR